MCSDRAASRDLCLCSKACVCAQTKMHLKACACARGSCLCSDRAAFEVLSLEGGMMIPSSGGSYHKFPIESTNSIETFNLDMIN